MLDGLDYSSDSDDSFDAFAREKKATGPSPTVAPARVDPLRAKADFEVKFALEAWYEELKEHTARTCFVEVSADEVRMLKKPCGEERRALEERLDAVLREEFGSNGCFAKLHTRSPKDAVVKLGGAFEADLRKRMAPFKKPLLVSKKELRHRQALVANDDCNLLSTLAREHFRMTSGKQILDLFQASSRVTSDLGKAADARRGSVIVLREFALCLPEHEYRCFVKGGRLTGMSQYCYSQYFASVVEQQKQVEARVQRFFKELPLPFENCVCDVVVSKESVSLIEINPWFNDTGALLFSWKSKEDREVLAGERPFEFRIRREVERNPYECIPYTFRTFFEEIRGFAL